MEYWKYAPKITSFQKKVIAEFASFSKLLQKNSSFLQETGY